MKIDILLTLYSLAAYFVKYLDQLNLTNAYIGGMQEGLGMKGNDFVNTGVMFSVGNIIFKFHSCILFMLFLELCFTCIRFRLVDFDNLFISIR